MWKVPDLRFLWTIGAALILLGGLGIFAVGSLVALPILLGGAALGASLDQSVRIVAFSSPLWAPVGAGMGMLVTSNLVKGLRAKPPN